MNEPSEWLKYRAKVTGQTIEEIRESMRARGAKADKSNSGFASQPKEKLQEYAARSRAIKEQKRGQGQKT